MLIYLEQLSPIKLLNTLATRSCKVTWQTKTIVSTLRQCKWPANLTGWRLTLRGSYHIVTWPFNQLVLLGSRESLNKLVSPFLEDLWPLHLVACWLRVRCLTRNRLSRYRLLVYNWVQLWQIMMQVKNSAKYSEPYQTSKMEFFTKKINSFHSSTIFPKKHYPSCFDRVLNTPLIDKYYFLYIRFIRSYH